MKHLDKRSLFSYRVQMSKCFRYEFFPVFVTQKTLAFHISCIVGLLEIMLCFLIFAHTLNTTESKIKFKTIL